MSEELRVALVAEGPTDRIFVESVLDSIFADRPYVLHQIQPEQSAAFGQIGTGWVGVYRWCKQAYARSQGHFRQDPLFHQFNLLILHLDADVADKHYSDGQIAGEPSDLPCAQPCPPPHSTTDALRTILLRWLGETSTPANVVICTPSKATEAWVFAALYPGHRSVGTIECQVDPEGQLACQPSKSRVRKKVRDYQQKKPIFTKAWPILGQALSEARRFDVEMKQAIAAIPV